MFLLIVKTVFLAIIIGAACLVPIIFLICIIGTVYYLIDRDSDPNMLDQTFVQREETGIGILALATTIPSLTYFLYYTVNFFLLSFFQKEVPFIWSIYIGSSIFLLGTCILTVFFFRRNRGFRDQSYLIGLLSIGLGISLIGITFFFQQEDLEEKKEITPYDYQILIFRSFLTAAFTIFIEVLAIFFFKKIGLSDLPRFYLPLQVGLRNEV